MTVDSKRAETVVGYVATLTCTQDPCTYCGSPDAPRPARTFDVRHSGGPYGSEGRAMKHAEAMARNVYGAPVHRAGVRPMTVDDLQ